MPWMNITCGQCRHEAGVDEWTRTPVGGELPPGTFQCPQCRFAFKRVQAPGRLYPDGFYMPGPVNLEPVEAML